MNETNKISQNFTKHLENTRDWSLIRYWRYHLHLSQSGNMSIFRTHGNVTFIRILTIFSKVKPIHTQQNCRLLFVQSKFIKRIKGTRNKEKKEENNDGYDAVEVTDSL